MGKKILQHKIFFLFFLGVIVQLALLPFPFHVDVTNSFAWGDYIVHHGSKNIYFYQFGAISRANANYPPFALWLCYIAVILTHVLKNGTAYLNSLTPLFPSGLVYFTANDFFFVIVFKLFLIGANIGIAWLGYTMVSQTSFEKYAVPTTALLLFSPPLLYGSTMWGQVDIFPLFFIFAAIYILLFKKNVLFSALCMVFALLCKQTVIIFFPIYLLVILKYCNWKQVAISLGIMIVGVWLGFIPFVNHWSSILTPFTVYLDKVQFASFTKFSSMSAWNIWAMFFGLQHIPDSTHSFIGLSYQAVGYTLTAVSLLLISYFFWKRTDKNTSEKLISALSAFFLISLASFLFLTRLHERHFLQVLPFIIMLYRGKREHLFPIIFLSFFIFLNLFYYWGLDIITLHLNAVTLLLMKAGIIGTLFIFFFYFYQFGRKRYK